MRDWKNSPCYTPFVQHGETLFSGNSTQVRYPPMKILSGFMNGWAAKLSLLLAQMIHGASRSSSQRQGREKKIEHSLAIHNQQSITMIVIPWLKTQNICSPGNWNGWGKLKAKYCLFTRHSMSILKINYLEIRHFFLCRSVLIFLLKKILASQPAFIRIIFKQRQGW